MTREIATEVRGRTRRRGSRKMRVVAWGMGVALLLLAAGLAYRWVSAPWPAQRVNAAGMRYLREHQASLDGPSDAWDTDLLASLVRGKQVFLLGEAHAVSDNSALDLALLKWLWTHVGVRIYIDESGYCSSAVVQRYLESGDEALLDLVYAGLQGTLAWTRERYDFWRAVRAWNLTLPEAERIRVVGLDVEHQHNTALFYLASLLPKSDPPKALVERVLELRDVVRSPISAADARPVAERLVASLDDSPAAWEAYLGEEWFSLNLGARNLLNVFAYRDADAQHWKEGGRIRDMAIYQNFVAVHERWPDVGYYGLWGRQHIARLPRGGVSFMAALLDGPESPVGGRVVSVSLFYDESERLMSSRSGYKRDDIRDPRWIVGPLLRAAEEGRWTLFAFGDANKPGESPLEQGLYLVQDATSGGVSTDYWQAAILVRGGTASRLMDE